MLPLIYICILLSTAALIHLSMAQVTFSFINTKDSLTVQAIQSFVKAFRFQLINI